MCDTFCDNDKLKKNLSQNLSYITITFTNANMHFKGCDRRYFCDKFSMHVIFIEMRIESNVMLIY